MNAKEAKKIAEEVRTGKSSMMTRLLDEVRREAMQGNTECIFSTNGEHFTDKELNYVRYTLGYQVRWNSPCLWYEVSWYEA